MDALISSLPENAADQLYKLYIYYNKYDDEGNICTKSQVAAAKAKGWQPYYYDIAEEKWKEYEGSDDESSSISLPELQNGTATIYTLHGQKVTTPVKGGIYIVDGKKVIVK